RRSRDRDLVERRADAVRDSSDTGMEDGFVDRFFRRHLADRRASRRVSTDRPSELIESPLAAHGRGFTVIEISVRLPIFALVATTVCTRSGEVLRQTSGLEERTLATYLADNELAMIRMSRLATNVPLVTGSQTRQVVMSGRNWTVTDKISDTSNPWL